jgi:soluble lytic murein transglycosylase-like protein
MMNRFNVANSKFAEVLARQPATMMKVAKTARSVATTAQHTLTVFGLSAVAVIALMVARPDLAKQAAQFLVEEPAEALVQAPALSDLMEAPVATEAQASSAPLTADQKNALGNKKQQQLVTSWLSKRYRVAGDAADMLVSTAYSTAQEIKLDPLLILAVMAIESGLNPFAESPVGAQGLMQVMSKVHRDRFQEMGGVQAALNPVANIRVGSLILKDYVTRGGSVEAGLKSYVGAAAFETDAGYGSKVMGEHQLLKKVAAGMKVSPTRSSAPMVAPAPATAVAEKETAPAKTHPKGEQLAGLL